MHSVLNTCHIYSCAVDTFLEVASCLFLPHFSNLTINKQLLDEAEHDIMNYIILYHKLYYNTDTTYNSSSETEAKRSAILFLRRTLQGA